MVELELVLIQTDVTHRHPPKTSIGASPQDERPSQLGDSLGLDRDVIVPQILLQLEDELKRQHRREAVWISVAVHLFAVIFLVLSPKISIQADSACLARRHHAQQATDLSRHAAGYADASSEGEARR